VLNIGAGEARPIPKKIIRARENDLTAIAARRQSSHARRRRSRTSKNQPRAAPVGVKVTLRKDRMYEFLESPWSAVALPRVRDFRAYRAKALTGGAITPWSQGAHRVRRDRPTTDRNGLGDGHHLSNLARTDAEAKALLEGFRMPFTKN